MRAFLRTSVLALALCAAPIVALPASKSTIVARGQTVCANAPNTIAGTPLDPRKFTLEPRNPPRFPISVAWCAPGSRTYVILTLTHLLPGDTIMDILNDSYRMVLGRLDSVGDTVISNGLFDWQYQGLSLRVWHSNNHQTTWGVLGAAIEAIADFMGQYGFAGASFAIYDGGNEVGEGIIG